MWALFHQECLLTGIHLSKYYLGREKTFIWNLWKPLSVSLQMTVEAQHDGWGVTWVWIDLKFFSVFFTSEDVKIYGCFNYVYISDRCELHLQVGVKSFVWNFVLSSLNVKLLRFLDWDVRMPGHYPLEVLEINKTYCIINANRGSRLPN